VSEVEKKGLRPLVFISHDHRDAMLAEGFANLLTDASGGFLKSFRSSDRKGGAGIEFGAEWYAEIMGKIDNATDVVALLTANSLDRPWILYEAGVAKGKLGKPVFGVVVGVAFDQATKGPFAQFQNSADDEDSLTKLVLQLIKRNSDAEPREEAVRSQVSAFRGSIDKLISVKEVKPAKPGDVEASDAAKLFEEIKVMFRDLPERLHGQLAESLGSVGRRRRKVHPGILMEFLHEGSEFADPAFAWLMTISLFRDDAPWLYELGLDVHKALKQGDPRRISTAIHRFEHSMEMVRHSRIGHFLIDSRDIDVAVHELGPIAHHVMERRLPQLPLMESEPKTAVRKKKA
jgi:hypothetical protein